MPESRSDVSPVPGGEVVVPPPDLMAGSDGVEGCGRLDVTPS
jgi:hypothetical protein